MIERSPDDAGENSSNPAVRPGALYRASRLGVVSLALLALTPGCVGEVADSEAGLENAVETSQDEIIGGTTLNPDIVTRRTLGLVDVGAGCSGALFHRDWVITATHCLNRTSIASNTFSIPRTTGVIDTRTATHISTLGTSDISIVRLSALTAGMSWPTVTRSMNTANPTSLVGGNITCYGRGMSEYRNPAPGFVGFGTWKALTARITALESDPVKGALFHFDATSAGREVLAPGDSGGPCFVGNDIAAVNSQVHVFCNDNSTPERCEATATKVTAGDSSVTSLFANYIAQAPLRTNHAQFIPITLNTGWGVSGPGTGLPEYALTASSSMVQLRGVAKSATGTTVPFTLPAAARPSARVWVPIVAIANNSYVNGRLRIEPSGSVLLNFEGGTPLAPHTIILDGTQYAVSAASTTAPALQNGWVAYGNSTRAPAARVVGNTVYLQGAISNPSFSANAHAMTLPAGFRPSATTYVPVDMQQSTRGRLIIRTDGVVTLQAEGAFSNATLFTSLEGASFALTTAGTTAAAYQNGWTTAAFGTRAVRFIDDGGVLRFQGAASNGTSQGVFTLPAQFRPATSQVRWVDGFGARKMLLQIEPSGAVGVFPIGGALDSRFTSFEGAAFGL